VVVAAGHRLSLVGQLRRKAFAHELGLVPLPFFYSLSFALCDAMPRNSDHGSIERSQLAAISQSVMKFESKKSLKTASVILLE
jgi:hypothetical protein